MGLFTEERAKQLGAYIVETGATVRQAAQRLAVSKSTVHVDVTRRLRRLDPDLYACVRQVLDENKRERHLRGGQATKRKFASTCSQQSTVNSSCRSGRKKQDSKIARAQEMQR